MQAGVTCRVQWVTRPDRMHELVEKMLALGAVLVGRSAYDPSTEDLDAMADAESGPLSIAEFKVDAAVLRHQLIEMVECLAMADTLLVDLTSKRLKVQVLPVASDHGVVIRRADGVHRLPRGRSGRHTRWLANQLDQQAYA
jgi:hypothetical protein